MMNARIDNVHYMFFMTIQRCTPTYIEVTSQAKKQQTSSQLQVGKWVKISNFPQNMACCKT